MQLKGTALWQAIWRLYEHSGFALAGAVAYSLLISLFPFCIFLGALASVLGGRDLATAAIGQLFHVLPARVVEGISPEVEAIMSHSRIGLLTASAGIALFFATSAIETMRAALNGAYRVLETRNYFVCLLISMGFVFVTALSMLVAGAFVIFGPSIAAAIEPDISRRVLNSSWAAILSRYGLAAAVMGAQLLTFHLWLAAGRRTVRDVLPGVLLSVVLWLALAGLYSWYLDLNDYSRFYAGLSQLMVALIFFQVTGMIIILGAELNRGLLELKKMGAGSGE